MKYRKLGNTGISVSEIGFGTIPILKGDVPVLPDYYNLENKQAIALMQKAYQSGCNLFDTAIVPEYGDAEIKLGLFAKTIDRSRIVIADKARFFSGNEIYQAVCDSIENLGGICPDIYFVHQVTPKNAAQTFTKNGAIDGLVHCKKEGKIRFVGVASHYYDILLQAACDKRVDVLQGSGNVLERGMLDRIEQEAAFRNKGFLLNKVYAAGLLPHFFAAEELIQGALSYPISSALIGIGTEQQLNVAINGVQRQPKRLSWQQVLAKLNQAFCPVACDRCQKCRCPYGIEPHVLLRQYNYCFMGKDYWALRKLNLDIQQTALQCRKCKEMLCEKECPQKLHISEWIFEIETLVQQRMYHDKI